MSVTRSRNACYAIAAAMLLGAAALEAGSNAMAAEYNVSVTGTALVDDSFGPVFGVAPNDIFPVKISFNIDPNNPNIETLPAGTIITSGLAFPTDVQLVLPEDVNNFTVSASTAQFSAQDLLNQPFVGGSQFAILLVGTFPNITEAHLLLRNITGEIVIGHPGACPGSTTDYCVNHFGAIIENIPNAGDDPIAQIQNVQTTVTLVTPVPATSYLYVTDALSPVPVWVIDTASNTVATTIPIPGAGTNGFGEAISSPSTSRVYVTNRGSGSNAGTIEVIDIVTNTVLASVLVGQSPTGVDITQDGSTLFVANFGSNTISVLDTEGNVVRDSIITAGNNPIDVAVTPDGAYIYVTHRFLPSVSVISTATHALVATVTVGNSPYGVVIAPNGDYAYVASSDSSTVSVIDTASNTVVHTVSVGAFPLGLAITPDGARVYVANQSDNSISVIDAVSNTVIVTIPVAANSPSLVAITPDGTRAYVTNNGFSTEDIVVVDTANNTVVDTILNVGRPFGIAIIHPTPDSDVDGVNDSVDNCPVIANPSQSNIDGDGTGDLCDICPSDNADSCDPTGSTASEATVDNGGTLTTPDGRLNIEIDPGDLATDATVSVTATTFNDPEVNLSISSNPGAGQAIAFYDLEPDGQQFANGVTLNIAADVTSFKPSQRNKIDLYRLEDTNNDGIPETFVSLGATCSVAEDPIGTFTATCTVQLDHFSTYAIVVPLDKDGDGVPDNFDGEADACPQENATGFDVDNDGCIDSFRGLADLVSRLVTEDVISSNMENSLLSKVDNAQSSSDRENVCTAVNQLDAFKNQVAAQTGKKISSEAASQVLEYADSVIFYLQSQLPSGVTC